MFRLYIEHLTNHFYITLKRALSIKLLNDWLCLPSHRTKLRKGRLSFSIPLIFPHHAKETRTNCYRNFNLIRILTSTRTIEKLVCCMKYFTPWLITYRVGDKSDQLITLLVVHAIWRFKFTAVSHKPIKVEMAVH